MSEEYVCNDIAPPPRIRRSSLATPASADTRIEREDPTEDGPREAAYEIGYGKPPSHSRFKPGQSGNPRGRPKRSKNFQTLVLQEMLKPVQVRTSKGLKKVTGAEALMMKAMENASKGNLRAIEKLFDWFKVATATREAQAFREDATLSLTDEAILEEFRLLVLAEREEGQ